MAPNEVIAVFAAALVLSVSCCGPQYSWRAMDVDGSRTAVTPAGPDNAAAAIGTVSADGQYVSPSGVVYDANTCTAQEAAIMLGLQDGMRALKQVVGHCPEQMLRTKPESPLTNMVVDWMTDGVSELSGRRVDVGFLNRGGIRVDFPQGDLLMDDVNSILPFKNKLAFVRIKGSNLRKLFVQMGTDGIQCVSGCALVYDADLNLLSAEVGGKPLDDARIYSLATVDFLLDGGDYFRIGDLAESVTLYDVLPKDILKERILAETAAGRPIAYEADGRIIIQDRQPDEK